MLSKVAVQEILVKYFKDTWRLLAILKTNKRVYEVIFFNMKKNVDSESVFTIHWDKTQILKKFRSDKINSTKKCPLFFWKLQRITVLLLMYDSSMSWSSRFVSPKLCVGFFIFDSVAFLLKFIFLFNKMHGLFYFKTS